MALSLAFRAVVLTVFVMLATLVMADVEVVLVLVAPVPIFAAVVLGRIAVTRAYNSVGRVIPRSVAVQLTISPLRSGKSDSGITTPLDS